jgi:hypothetical protein
MAKELDIVNRPTIIKHFPYNILASNVQRKQCKKKILENEKQHHKYMYT